MLVADAIAALIKMPHDAPLCLLHGSEYFEIEGIELKKAYQGSQPQWLYSGVEFPQDYNKTKVAKICRRKK